MSRARYIGKIALMTASHASDAARLALGVECVVEFHYGRGFFYTKNTRCAPRDANGRGKS